MKLRLKRNNKIGLIFFLAFVISTSLLWFFEERFTEEQWTTKPMSRHKIVDDLIESQILLDKSKPEVIKLLGEPSSILSNERDVMLYEIGLAPGFNEHEVEQLFIEFINDTVYKASLAVY